MSLDTDFAQENEAGHNASRTCVVVLGSGRSGTSLTARILSELGVRLNYNPGSKSDQNPDGLYEDEFIVQTHKELFAADKLQANLPLPATWAASPAARSAGNTLAEYIRSEFGSDALWGFKDPRTAMLLPMWKRIFNRERIVPKYILCVRDPAAVVHSMSTNYHDEQSTAELLWLSRNVAILRDTGLYCFIVHYETLISDPISVITPLAEYILGSPIDPERAAAIARSCVKSGLDRSNLNSVSLENPLIPHLMAELSKCEGHNFDKAGLAAAVQYCDRVLKATTRRAVELQINGQQMQQDNRRLTEEVARLRKLQSESKNEANMQIKKQAALGEALKKKATELQKLRSKREREMQIIHSRLNGKNASEINFQTLLREIDATLALARVGRIVTRIAGAPVHRRLIRSAATFFKLLAGRRL